MRRRRRPWRGTWWARCPAGAAWPWTCAGPPRPPSARAPRAAPAAGSAHTLPHRQRAILLRPLSIALCKFTEQPMPILPVQAMQHAPGYLTVLILWAVYVKHVEHGGSVQDEVAGCAPRPWLAVRLSGAGLPARAWLPLRGRRHARGWAGSAPVQQGQALSGAASAHCKPGHLSHPSRDRAALPQGPRQFQIQQEHDADRRLHRQMHCPPGAD